MAGIKDVIADNNRKITHQATQQRPSVPRPPAPPGDPAWVKDQQGQGTLPSPTRVQPMPILEGARGQAQVAMTRHHDTLDTEVGQKEWEQVYLAYGDTGSTGAIAQRTGIPTGHVKHLIEYGCKRLGLPSIREHAVDHAKVALQPLSNADQDNFLLNLPDVQDAVTKRAARECAAAQATLQSVMETSDLALGYVKALVQGLTTGQVKMEVPEDLQIGHLEKLTKMLNSLTNAVDTASQVSRRAAGEPEKHLSMEVAILVGAMTDDELQSYFSTGKPPRRLLSSSGIAAMSLPADSPDAIEADFSPIPGFDTEKPEQVPSDD